MSSATMKCFITSRLWALSSARALCSRSISIHYKCVDCVDKQFNSYARVLPFTVMSDLCTCPIPCYQSPQVYLCTVYECAAVPAAQLRASLSDLPLPRVYRSVPAAQLRASLSDLPLPRVYRSVPAAQLRASLSDLPLPRVYRSVPAAQLRASLSDLPLPRVYRSVPAAQLRASLSDLPLPPGVSLSFCGSAQSQSV